MEVLDVTLPNQSQRAADGKWRKVMCWFAQRASEAWDWFDKRQIFERFVALAILFGTVKITAWAMNYAEMHTEKTGIEAAAIIAAVLAPYMALQGAAIAFMFRARMG
jgi:hypothetical protein